MSPTLRLLGFFLLALSLAGSAWSIDCKLACKTEACALSPTTERALTRNSWLLFRQCEKLEVREGEVELRYMHKTRWFMPPALAKNDAVAAVFKNYPPDTCAVLSAQCVQTSMAAKQAAVGGHGIDNRVSKPGGEGEPCSLGLPCGSVLPAAGASLTVRLNDPGARGLLKLQVARGQPPASMPAQLEVPVQAGRASIDGRWLQPGGLYTYQFSPAGKPGASGEFSLVSLTMAERLRKRAATRQEQQGLSAGQAWYDTLLENQLLWDALQLDLEASP